MSDKAVMPLSEAVENYGSVKQKEYFAKKNNLQTKNKEALTKTMLAIYESANFR